MSKWTPLLTLVLVIAEFSQLRKSDANDSLIYRTPLTDFLQSTGLHCWRSQHKLILDAID